MTSPLHERKKPSFDFIASISDLCHANLATRFTGGCGNYNLGPKSQVENRKNENIPTPLRGRNNFVIQLK